MADAALGTIRERAPAKEARAIPLGRGEELQALPSTDDAPGEVIEPGRALAIADFAPPSLGAGEALIRLAYRLGVSGTTLVRPFGKAANWSLPALIGAALILACKLLVAFLLAGIIENAMARTQFVRTHKLTRYGLGLALLALLAYLVGV